MPILTWETKGSPEPIKSELIQDSIIYPGGFGYPSQEPENHLILGDNIPIMSALMTDYEGKIDLIYADPPFFSNRRYKTRIGRGEDSRRPSEWQLGEGYTDHWENIESYLDMLYPRLVLMYQLLSSTGTLYLHLDWHAVHYAKLLLDELFGVDRFLNEIIWTYHGPSPIRSAFKRKHDTILIYTKSKDYTFNADAVRIPYNSNTVKTFASSSKAGFGKVPDLKRGKVPEDWWYFPVVARLHNERTGYPTQKPEGLLERIIRASSNPGDLVADFFCGSGTAPVIAARLGRKFIASDLKWRAIYTTISRCIDLEIPPISLEIEQRMKIPRTQVPAENYLSFSSNAKQFAIRSEVYDNLDYWEVDPNWDGRLFRSAIQAKRPKRKGKLLGQIDLSGWDGDKAIRFVRLNGEQVQTEIKKNNTSVR
ncbi:MAG: site-specific DNA-methyltransferase [Anaerolineales bacterium]|nr:site-specific DNA-methyltransferase [Anaerolineales bacterium]